MKIKLKFKLNVFGFSAFQSKTCLQELEKKQLVINQLMHLKQLTLKRCQ